LNGIEGISFVYLNKHDIVRHPLVQKIVAAYEENNGQADSIPKEAESDRRPVNSEAAY